MRMQTLRLASSTITSGVMPSMRRRRLDAKLFLASRERRILRFVGAAKAASSSCELLQSPLTMLRARALRLRCSFGALRFSTKRFVPRPECFVPGPECFVRAKTASNPIEIAWFFVDEAPWVKNEAFGAEFEGQIPEQLASFAGTKLPARRWKRFWRRAKLPGRIRSSLAPGGR